MKRVLFLHSTSSLIIDAVLPKSALAAQRQIKTNYNGTYYALSEIDQVALVPFDKVYGLLPTDVQKGLKGTFAAQGCTSLAK